MIFSLKIFSLIIFSLKTFSLTKYSPPVGPSEAEVRKPSQDTAPGTRQEAPAPKQPPKAQDRGLAGSLPGNLLPAVAGVAGGIAGTCDFYLWSITEFFSIFLLVIFLCIILLFLILLFILFLSIFFLFIIFLFVIFITSNFDNANSRSRVLRLSASWGTN